jgi:hypothetical protein
MGAIIDGNEAQARRLAAWLRGEPVPLEDAKYDGIFEQPTDENGFSMMRSLLQVVYRLGYAGTVLLFDEGERRLSIEGKPDDGTAEAMDQLRELVDLCGRSELPRTLILYAVTPAFTQDVLPAYPALQQRLGSPVQFLSPHNPKAPLIDLEALDLDPPRLLTEVGGKLAHVAMLAYDWHPTPDVIGNNLKELVATVTEEQLEVSHRRLFVKTWIRLLDDMRIGVEREMTVGEIHGLVRDEQSHLLVEEQQTGAVTFFGSPLSDPERPRPRAKRTSPGKRGKKK